MIMDGRRSISVVLVVRNHLPILKASMRVWLHNCTNYMRGSELIIVDDGSTDGSQEFLEEFLNSAKTLGLKIVYVPLEDSGEPNLGHAFNTGVEYVEGAHVLFATGDMYPHGVILNTYADYIGEKTLVSGCHTSIREVFNYGMRMDETRSMEMAYLVMEKQKEPWKMYRVTNSVIPKAVIDSLGGFNEKLGNALDVGHEFAALAVLKDGCVIKSLKEAKVYEIKKTMYEQFPPPSERVVKLISRYQKGKYNRSMQGIRQTKAS